MDDQECKLTDRQRRAQIRRRERMKNQMLADRRAEFLGSATRAVESGTPLKFAVAVPVAPRRVRRPKPLTPGNTWGMPFDATVRRIHGAAKPQTPQTNGARPKSGEPLKQHLPKGYLAWLRETKKARNSIPPRVRRAVYRRDRLCCRFCRSMLGPFNLVHLVPWSRGVVSTTENVVVGCARCNVKKGNRAPLSAVNWDKVPTGKRPPMDNKELRRLNAGKGKKSKARSGQGGPRPVRSRPR